MEDAPVCFSSNSVCVWMHLCYFAFGSAWKNIWRGASKLLRFTLLAMPGGLWWTQESCSKWASPILPYGSWKIRSRLKYWKKLAVKNRICGDRNGVEMFSFMFWPWILYWEYLFIHSFQCWRLNPGPHPYQANALPLN